MHNTGHDQWRHLQVHHEPAVDDLRQAADRRRGEETRLRARDVPPYL